MCNQCQLDHDNIPPGLEHKIIVLLCSVQSNVLLAHAETTMRAARYKGAEETYTILQFSVKHRGDMSSFATWIEDDALQDHDGVSRIEYHANFLRESVNRRVSEIDMRLDCAVTSQSSFFD